MIRTLEYVSQIKPYVPGKPIKELERELGISGSIKLASNENPLGPSPNAVKALRDLLKNPKELCRYPDGSGYYLKNAISEKLSVSRETLILGNGSNELIDIAVRTFMGPGDEAVMAAPSFVVYSLAVKSVGGKAIETPLENYTHDLDAMADAITKKTKLVFIANPNNPTGTIVRKDEFERFMDKVPEDVLVVIDEAYYEYVRDANYPDTLKYLRDMKNMLILRTFSKAYGLAGLRIGYGIANKALIEEMNKIREPFNTSAIAQIAAFHALSDARHIERSIRMNEDGKRFLYRELDLMGLAYVPTEANFIYIPMDVDANAVYERLLKSGVIVRPVGHKEIRVTIGLPDENKRFIETLKNIFMQS